MAGGLKLPDGITHPIPYFEAELYLDDIKLLRPPNWMNDAAVTFALEYIRNEVSDNLCYIPPMVSFMLLCGTDSEIIKDSKIGNPDSKYICIPVNNNTDADVAGGGSHWSMLIWDTSDNHFYHADSLSSGENRRQAQTLARIIDPKSTYHDLSVPSQTNAYDCGAHACSTAEAVSTTQSLNPETLRPYLEPLAVQSRRQTWLTKALKIQEQ